ncbi:C-GCAxxG-C-C family protein [Clostridium thailandense]|uniref:C-GCAxxG-C-C family protein n=1 Tax=Clostridium thailandense TaxID=2794346 RepID=UPI001FE2EB9A|nr:C-GCAxxG-C-C family protein [Clostridium thailandense]
MKGRENNDELNNARKYTKELMMDIKEKYGTKICKDLKKNGISCAEIIDYTYEVLNELI